MKSIIFRHLIREMLLEDLKGFQQRTKGSDYMSSFDDPTFDQPYQKQLPHKTLAKDVKRAWAQEADHNFMKSLIKVHWLSGLDWEKKLDRFLSLGGNNEVSAMGYLPDSKKVKSSWGTVGVIIQGRVTLAANDMNAITSGYFKDVPGEVTSKYKSSGVPRRATMFRSDPSAFGGAGSQNYILDRESFNPERSRHNEFIVDNWNPVALVIDSEADLFLDSVRAAVKGKIRPVYLDYAKGMLKQGLPIYDMTMTPIDRNKLEEATRGEGKDANFDFP